MSTSPSIDRINPGPEPAASQAPATAPDIVLCVASMPPDALNALLHSASEAFAGESVLLASPDRSTEEFVANLRIVPFNTHTPPGWVLNAAAYASAGQLASEHNPSALLLLGPDAASIPTPKLHEMVDLIRRDHTDLVLPRTTTGPDQGLVNSAMLYPLTRALFGADIHFPLPTDAGLSPRMAQRLAVIAQRQTPGSQGEALLWPVAEACVAAFAVREVAVGARALPRPPSEDFNSLFATVANSLFADIEAKATYWQRARTFTTTHADLPTPPSNITPSAQILSLVDGFRLAYANLQEIWSLVLPPQTLLALKRLSVAPPEAFAIAPSLWARIVFDFALSFHLRSINRGHLLGAFTPLYLAWVASHLRSVEPDPARAPQLIAQTAAAFELEKPYLVSRWRWPDRFNP